MCVCVYAYVLAGTACVRACVHSLLRVPLASYSSEMIEVIIIKLGIVTALDMLMYHVLIILTLTFIQAYTDLNHENNKCLIISKTIQSMTFKFAVKIV